MKVVNARELRGQDLPEVGPTRFFFLEAVDTLIPVAKIRPITGELHRDHGTEWLIAKAVDNKGSAQC